MGMTLNNENLFFILLNDSGIEKPEKEFRFHPQRKWRFDYAFPHVKLAIEVEGGVYTQGRHTRIAGFKGDIEKYNEATRYGWRLLRVQPERLCNYEFITLVLDTYNDTFTNFNIEEYNEQNPVRRKKSRPKRSLAGGQTL